MSFVPKPNGNVRSVVDLEKPMHPFPAPKDIAARVPKGKKCFAVFTAVNGYWQIPLEEESGKFTTFITEWGRFRYKRAPTMVLVSLGDEFCARTDRALADIQGVYKLVDNILICIGLCGAASLGKAGVRAMPRMGHNTVQEEVQGWAGG